MGKIFLSLIRSRPLRRLINPGYKKAGMVDKGTIAIIPCIYTRLGDWVMYNCSIQQLQQRYRVLFIVPETFYDANRAFLQEHLLIREDDILILPHHKRKWFSFILQLRARKINAAIYDLSPVLPESILYLAGVPVIISGKGTSSLANREYFVHYDLHYAERANLILGALGVGKIERRIAPFLRYRHIDLPELDGFDGETLVVHSGGGDYWMRKWPQENFYETCRLFLAHYHGRVLLVGGKEEFETNETVRERLLANGYPMDSVVNLCGIPLNTSLNVIARSSVFIGNDSGPLHCAVALGVRVIGIFGPSAIRVVNPTECDERNVTVHADLDCVPCNSMECRLEEGKKFMCLTGLAVEPVWKALQKTLMDHSRKVLV